MITVGIEYSMPWGRAQISQTITVSIYSVAHYLMFNQLVTASSYCLNYFLIHLLDASPALSLLGQF